MTAPAKPVRYCELHGDKYDGFMMVTPLADPPLEAIIVPVDPHITTKEQYSTWKPKDGDYVVVYGFDGQTPRKTATSGERFHHHYNAVTRLHLGEGKTT